MNPCHDAYFIKPLIVPRHQPVASLTQPLEQTSYSTHKACIYTHPAVCCGVRSVGDDERDGADSLAQALVVC
eukprot:477994-Pelagomonas_calceolata.AAC.3